jgi:hypothetical protein
MINDKNLDGRGGCIRNFSPGITEKQRKTSLLMTGSLAVIDSKSPEGNSGYLPPTRIF